MEVQGSMWWSMRGCMGGGSTGEVLGGSMWVWNLYKILGVLQYGSRIRGAYVELWGTQNNRVGC